MGELEDVLFFFNFERVRQKANFCIFKNDPLDRVTVQLQPGYFSRRN
jgi:hypothetical protein